MPVECRSKTAIHAFRRPHRGRARRGSSPEIVKAPSDNPPGDCAGPRRDGREAARRPGLHGRAAQGPGSARQGQRHDLGDQSDRAAPVRAGRPDHRPQRPWRRRAAGRGLDARPVRRRDRRRLDVSGAASPCRSRTSPPTLSRCLALEKAGAQLNGTVELHVTYDEEAGGEIGPRYILEQGLSRPDLAIGAGFSYAVVTAHNGCLHLEVEAARPLRPRRPSVHRRRRAGSGQCGPDRPLRLARRPRGADLRRSRHRLAADDGRAHLGRDQHQRRARTASRSGSTGA